MRTIGITLGDPCGIGPEVVVKGLARYNFRDQKIKIYGSPLLLRSLPPCPEIEVVAVGPNPQNGFTIEDRSMRARAVLETLDRAISDAMEAKIHAIVTAPIDKAVVRTLLPDFTGHTEYLAQKTGVARTVMLLDNTEIRVIPVTQHIPLRDVARLATTKEFEETLEVAVKSLREWFGIRNPRIAVAGINPHAGEIVENSEEDQVIRPLIRKLQGLGWRIEGPFAADSLFPLARKGGWDLLVSPYHDQGLIAAKYPGLDKVVNITLGLPFLRISPGHGTAYDIAGKGLADSRSFERALKIAMEGQLS